MVIHTVIADLIVVEMPRLVQPRIVSNTMAAGTGRSADYLFNAPVLESSMPQPLDKVPSSVSVLAVVMFRESASCIL